MAVNRETLKLVAEQRAQLAALLAAQDADLAARWLQAWADVVDELTEMIDRLAGVGGARVSWVARRRQAERAAHLLAGQLQQILAEQRAILDANMERMLAALPQQTWQLIASQLPAGALNTLVPGTDLRQIDAILRRTTEQITARQYFLQHAATEAMKRELGRAIPLGVNPNEVARRMIRAVQGEFNGGLHRARVVARTELLDAYRAAAEAAHNANRDVLAGWQWVAALSERTCRSCVAMHGTIHSLDEPGPLDHQQGRCARVPITKAWRDLGFPGSEPAGAIHPGDGERWLRKQSEKTQQHILGRRGYNQWVAGNWPREQWSQLRTTEGWRDSYGAAAPPKRKPAPGWRGEKLPPPPPGQSITPNHPDWAHWRARQGALRSAVAPGRTLEPREIVFAEHIESLGFIMPWLPLGEWLANGSRLPSNDVIWPLTLSEVEHKTIKTISVRAAKDAISKDRRAAFVNHQFRKDAYLIDLGDRDIPDNLARSLANYSPERPLEELWIFGNGRILRLI